MDFFHCNLLNDPAAKCWKLGVLVWNKFVERLLAAESGIMLDEHCRCLGCEEDSRCLETPMTGLVMVLLVCCRTKSLFGKVKRDWKKLGGVIDWCE